MRRSEPVYSLSPSIYLSFFLSLSFLLSLCFSDSILRGRMYVRILKAWTSTYATSDDTCCNSSYESRYRNATGARGSRSYDIWYKSSTLADWQFPQCCLSYPVVGSNGKLVLSCDRAQRQVPLCVGCTCWILIEGDKYTSRCIESRAAVIHAGSRKYGRDEDTPFHTWGLFLVEHMVWLLVSRAEDNVPAHLFRRLLLSGA